MQSAETVLDVLRERGRRQRGLPCNELPATVQPAPVPSALRRLYSNQGAMTPGVDGETVDGMSQGQDRAHHRCDTPQALPVSTSQESLYPEEERET
jgi:hypothetical protein